MGGGPIAHRPRPVGGVDLETVQTADQLDLAGSDPGDLRLRQPTSSSCQASICSSTETVASLQLSIPAV